jgi:steroid delta-isomerase-like uncharacterized protein
MIIPGHDVIMSLIHCVTRKKNELSKASSELITPSSVMRKTFYGCASLCVFIITLFIFGCKKEKRMGSEELKSIVRREIEEIWNKRDLAAANEIIGSDYILHEAAEDIQGLEAFKMFAADFHTSFPDAHFDIDDVIVESDKVVLRYTFLGNHEGDFLGIATTGKKVTATGIRFSRVADGKIQETWNYLDRLSILLQLGWWVPPEDWQLAYEWGEQMVQGIETTSDLDRIRILARRGLKELWDTGDLAIADEVYAGNFINHEITHRQFHNLESYKKYVTVIHRAMRDFRVVIEGSIAEGDEVAIRWNVSGTAKANGDEFAWGGITIFRFSDHKIVEAWWSRDALGIAQQLGIVPELEKRIRISGD